MNPQKKASESSSRCQTYLPPGIITHADTAPRCPYLCDIQLGQDGRLRFVITPADTMVPLVADTPDAALNMVTDQLVRLRPEAFGSDRNSLQKRISMLVRRRCCKKWIDDGHAFFGLSVPEVCAAIEALPNTATLGLFGPESARYRFKYVVPSPQKIDLVRERASRLKDTVSCARVDDKWTPSMEHQKGLSSAFNVRNVQRVVITDDVSPDGMDGGGSSSGNSGAVAGANGADGSTQYSHTANVAVPLTMRYRQMQDEPTEMRIRVQRSGIHGWGVFAVRDIGKDEIISEYVGEKVRQIVADIREAEYDRDHRDGGLLGGCYMFRVDAEHIIDATRIGNHARFVNHSCEANAYARVGVLPDMSKHIFIFAQRNIFAGEEVTYDYQFPLEETAVICNCGSSVCIGRMN